MDPLNKFDKRYYIATHHLGHYRLYNVEFDPRTPGQVRGLNNPSPRVPPGPKATVEIVDNEARFKYWDGTPPQDQDITRDEFEREAERRALEEYRRLQAA
jgi:hypothetical protein